MIAAQDAVDHLFRVAVTEEKATSTSRLDVLADFCVQELQRRGLHGVEKEASVPGAGRDKKWDVAWRYEGKYRLGISLKSLLKNLGGTVPNRIDDLIGEATNAQLHSPEIVIGYIMHAGVGTPTDWAECDGGTFLRYIGGGSTGTATPLFASIGTTFGSGDGSTTANRPDLRKAFPRGAGSGLARGATGGSETHTLAVSQLPEHRHSDGTLSVSTAGTHRHEVGSLAVGSAGAHTHSSGTLTTASDGAHTHTSGSLLTASAGAHTHARGTLATGDAGWHTSPWQKSGTGLASARSKPYTERLWRWARNRRRDRGRRCG